MMELQQTHVWETERRSFVFDTTFVLFFLAVDCGQRFTFGIDGMLSAVTLAMFVVLPYFLPSREEKPDFERWLFGRVCIAAFAILLGAIFRQTLGVFLPDMLRFLPLTLLIVAGMISCYIQFNSLLRFRLAK
ncbi:MAG: hypothetical protein ABIU09_01505 [Pyrinomonadaceae bacterium]